MSGKGVTRPDEELHIVHLSMYMCLVWQIMPKRLCPLSCQLIYDLMVWSICVLWHLFCSWCNPWNLGASKSSKALGLEDQSQCWIPPECIIPAIEICIILVIITETFQLTMCKALVLIYYSL